MRRKSKYFYFFGLLIFIVWLSASTSIISSLYDGAPIEKVADEDFPYTSLEITPYYDFSAQYDGGLFESVSMKGWSLIEVDGDNSERQMSIYLKGANNSYKVSLNCIERPDVRINLAKILQRKDLLIPSDNVGYEESFSTLSVAEGVYDIYLYCYENDTVCGMKDVGYQLIKGARTADIVKWQGEKLQESIDVTTTNEMTIGNLELISDDGTNVTISGWGAILDKDSSSQCAYVQFINSKGERISYSTKQQYSGDVSAYMGSELYSKCRYFTSFNNDEIDNGIYTVTVVIQNEEKTISSVPYLMNKNENGIAFGELQRQETAQVIAENLSQSDLQPEYKQAWSYMNQDGGYTMLALVQTPVEGDGQRVLLKLNLQDGSEKYVFCEGDSSRLAGAFKLTIPGELMGQLVNAQVCTTDGKNLYISDLPFVPQLDSPEVEQEELSPYDPGRFTEANVATVEDLENGGIRISGWTVVQGEDSGDETHYVRLDYEDGSTAFIKALTVYRPDVSIYLGDGRYDWSGFYAEISPEYLDPYPVTFAIATDTGDALVMSPNVFSAQTRTN